MIVEIHPTHPEPRKIARAAQVLAEGGTLAYPTDTVYALGCAVAEKKAIESLYFMKQLRKDQPLALVVPDLAGIARLAVVQDFHYRFIRHLVPGPYVFILEATREVPRLVMMKRKTIGIRVPEHPVALALATAFGAPLISTTASHPSTGPEALQDPRDIADRFGPLSLVLDAGVGGTITSTVIDLTGREPRLQRVGAGMDRLEKLFGLRPSLEPEDR
jgi:tRNA threonylcarbamoyl adenosine modification protein (Sua5/YciO/YrdC/YwlC family)